MASMRSWSSLVAMRARMVPDFCKALSTTAALGSFLSANTRLRKSPTNLAGADESPAVADESDALGGGEGGFGLGVGWRCTALVCRRCGSNPCRSALA